MFASFPTQHKEKIKQETLLLLFFNVICAIPLCSQQQSVVSLLLFGLVLHDER